MKKEQFQNKVCWITGASSGIGAALANALSIKNSFIILSGRNTENLEYVRLRCAYPDRVRILAFDMEATESLPGYTQTAWNLFGGIDYIFLNAGVAVRDWVTNIELKMLRKVMEVNFFSSVIIAQTLLPLMVDRQHGHFIVTSSLSGKYGIPKLSIYAASKHALHGFFESMRAEYYNKGIRVTMIVPGLVKTDITIHSLTGDGAISGKMQEAVANGLSPEKCANMLLKKVALEKNEAIIGGNEIYSVYMKRFFPAFWDNMIRNNPLQKLRSMSPSRIVKKILYFDL